MSNRLNVVREGGRRKANPSDFSLPSLAFIGLMLMILMALGVWIIGFILGNGRGYAAGPSASPVPSLSVPSATFTLTSSPTPTLTPTFTPTPTSRPTLTPRPPLPTAALLNNDWQRLPIIPEVSPAMKEVYLRGLALGNDPRAFSKVGDCNSEVEFFLTPFDQPGEYRLGPYADLQAVIDNFGGSFSRVSVAARTGFGPSAMFDPIWVDPRICRTGEGPLDCEYRLHRPSIVLIGLGTHYSPLSKFESQMRAVIEASLERGIVPVLTTKVDTEGGDRVNALIAYLAQQYEVPLWNFWLAVQPLDNHGQPDEIHFTWARNYFDLKYNLLHGWPVRNLTALQALDTVWRSVAE